MTRPNRFPGAARRAALLVATTSALTIACLAPPTGTGVLLVTPPAASVGVGDAVRLTALPQDDGSAPARAPAVTWTSSDTSVATVDATGLVTGVAPGSSSPLILRARWKISPSWPRPTALGRSRSQRSATAWVGPPATMFAAPREPRSSGAR